MHHFFLIVHVLAAAVWVGGHLVLSVAVLPKAIRLKDPTLIVAFEKVYEKTGLTSLLFLVITGITMSFMYGVKPADWFAFNGAIETVISIKLLLLFCTIGLAVHARLFIVPRLSASKIWLMAFHILAITLIGVGMLTLGTFVRFGGI